MQPLNEVLNSALAEFTKQHEPEDPVSREAVDDGVEEGEGDVGV